MDHFSEFTKYFQGLLNQLEINVDCNDDRLVEYFSKEQHCEYTKKKEGFNMKMMLNMEELGYTGSSVYYFEIMAEKWGGVTPKQFEDKIVDLTETLKTPDTQALILLSEYTYKLKESNNKLSIDDALDIAKKRIIELQNADRSSREIINIMRFTDKDRFLMESGVESKFIYAGKAMRVGYSIPERVSAIKFAIETKLKALALKYFAPHKKLEFRRDYDKIPSVVENIDFKDGRYKISDSLETVPAVEIKTLAEEMSQFFDIKNKPILTCDRPYERTELLASIEDTMRESVRKRFSESNAIQMSHESIPNINANIRDNEIYWISSELPLEDQTKLQAFFKDAGVPCEIIADGDYSINDGYWYETTKAMDIENVDIHGIGFESFKGCNSNIPYKNENSNVDFLNVCRRVLPEVLTNSELRSELLERYNNPIENYIRVEIIRNDRYRGLSNINFAENFNSHKIPEADCKKLGIVPTPSLYLTKDKDLSVNYVIDIEQGKIYFNSEPRISYNLNEKEKVILQDAIKNSISEYKFEHEGKLSPYEQRLYRDSAREVTNKLKAKSSSSIKGIDSIMGKNGQIQQYKSTHEKQADEITQSR